MKIVDLLEGAEKGGTTLGGFPVKVLHIQDSGQPEIDEEGVAEGADDKFSVADKVEELVDQYRLYDKRGWSDLFTNLAGRKLEVAEIRREMEYASKFLQLLDSIRMRSDYQGQQGAQNDQELIDLSNQWLSLFNKATSEFKAMSGQGVAEGENFATFEDIHSLTKLAGIPVAESRLMDATGETIDHILDRFKYEVRNFEATDDLDDDLYDALSDYYSNKGDMPYRIMSGRTGDPYEWVSDHLAKHLGMNEGVLGTVGGAMLGSVMGPVGAAVGGVAGQEMTKGGSGIVEGSCNQTMEGEYCPEHGLMECGSSMYEMSTVAGSVAPGVVTPAQNMAEGTALLARIKALALIR